MRLLGRTRSRMTAHGESETGLATRGTTAVELNVEADNHNAVRPYELLGMQIVERPERP